MRKNIDIWKKWNCSMGMGLHRTQIQILCRAVQIRNPTPKNKNTQPKPPKPCSLFPISYSEYSLFTIPYVFPGPFSEANLKIIIIIIIIINLISFPILDARFRVFHIPHCMGLHRTQIQILCRALQSHPQTQKINLQTPYPLSPIPYSIFPTPDSITV